MSRNRTLTAAVIVAGLLAVGGSSELHARAVGSPQVGYGERVNAYSTTYYNISFHAGELAEVLVVGDGDTDLDLYIYDENGVLIDSDTDLTDVCLCQWTPKWTGSFRIEVVNLGNVYNLFDIETN